MSEWMWFVALLVAMFLGYAGWTKWVDARIQLEQILREETGVNDDQDNLQDR